MYIDDNVLKLDDRTIAQYKSLITRRAIHGVEVYKEVDDLTAHGIEQHYMDKSTGTVREQVTLWMTGAEQFNPDGGPAYDGYRTTPLHSNRTIEYIETKPILVTRTQSGKCGHGSINDHSLTRHERFLDDGLIMQGSTFFHGTLAFIFEFPYADMEEHMARQIKTAKGRCCGRFSFSNWQNANVRMTYLNKDVIESHRDYIPGGGFVKPKKTFLFQWLMDQDEILLDI